MRGRWVTVGIIGLTSGLVLLAAIGRRAATAGDLAAVADGKADATAAIQAAVDGRAGTIRFPPGTYRITRPITVELDRVGFTAFVADGPARLVMAGAGPAIRFVGTHAGTADPKSFKPAVWDRQRTPMVEGLEIVGDHSDADGIAAEGTMGLTLQRVGIRLCRHGVHLVKRNRNVLISACHIYENRGIGVYYDHVNLHQSNIVGCHISYCDGGGVVSRGGEVRNVQITGCDIESCMGAKGPPTANVLLDCTGGSIAEVAITGCTIQHNSTGPDSANVRLLGRGDDLKGKAGGAQWGHVTITGNVFSDVQTNVDIRDARGVTLTGNTFWMGYAYNLRVEDSQQIVVGSNAFERNPGYAYGTSRNTKNALLFRNCQDCTLTGLHVHGVYGVDAAVTLDRCRRMNVTGCTILDCDAIGLLCDDVTHSRVSDCLIRHDGKDGGKYAPLRVVGGRGNQFASNLFGRPVEIPRDAGTSDGNRVVD
ncbi:MAG: right-handed parallel beta-helix repeat-containing protein [Gemmataceae bacterium]